jgi:hypothetical protein
LKGKGTAAPAGSGAASSVQDHPATYAAGLRCRKIRPSRRGDRRDRVGAAREMLVKAWRHASGEPGYGLDSPRVQDLFQYLVFPGCGLELEDKQGQHRLQGSIPGPETRAPLLGEARARIETIRQESPGPPSGTARAPPVLTGSHAPIRSLAATRFPGSAVVRATDGS